MATPIVLISNHLGSCDATALSTGLGAIAFDSMGDIVELEGFGLGLRLVVGFGGGVAAT